VIEEDGGKCEVAQKDGTCRITFQEASLSLAETN
jgi:hypothetical protein